MEYPEDAEAALSCITGIFCQSSVCVPATRIRLLTRFGSAERIAAATVEEIMEIPGIGRRRAIQISDYFRKKQIIPLME